MSKERIDVFISSTSHDLPDYRKVALEAILELDFHPSGMEHWSITGEDSVELCKQKVEEAHIFLGIYAHRYGWRPPGYDGKSITELEYDWAHTSQWMGKPIPRLCFIMKDGYPVPDNIIENDATEDLERFKERVKAHQVGFFTTPENLKSQIVSALANIKTTLRPTDSIVWERNEQLDQYTLRRQLGQGGNGQVWLADEELPDKTSREVAIKVLRDVIAEDETRVERFKREISIMARITHPHIVTIFTSGERNEQLYVIMQYLSGGTLREKLTGEPLPMDEALHWLEQIGSALDHVHDRSHGVIHRDVKPENMLIGEDGRTLYLADFGLVFSTATPSNLTKGSNPAGTGRYMAPEQWRGETLSRHTDLYALGILAYQLLTGQLPYQADNDYHLAKAHCEEELPQHPKLPIEILRILHKATEERPENRYSTARAFLTDLRNWDADPANLNPRISDYLDWLTGDIYHRIVDRFVELSADETHIKEEAKAKKKRPRRHYFGDDDDLDDAITSIHGDYIPPTKNDDKEAQSIFVEQVSKHMMRLQKAVLIGEPGSGKSFMLLRLSIEYMQAWLKAYENGDTTNAKIPVLVYLNEYKRGNFVEFVRDSMDILAPYHDKLLSEGKLVLLCDALNEMPRTQNQMEQLLQYLGNVPYFVVSCRVRDYRDELRPLKQLEQIRLHDLELPAIRDLIYKRLPTPMAESLWQAMGGSDKLMQFWQDLHDNRKGHQFWDPLADIRHIDYGNLEEAWRNMHTGARLLPLARNPYMAEMLCRTYQSGDGQLPKNRAELFGLFISQMLVREVKAATRRGETFPPTADIENALIEFARALQDFERTVISWSRATTVTSVRLLKSATDANILTMDGNNIRFAHQLLQEYFAARVLLEKMQIDEHAGGHAHAELLFEGAWWDAGVWRETSVILGEFLGDGARGANRVARWLAPVSPEVALQVITRNGAGFTPDDVEPKTREALIASAQAKINDTSQVGQATAYRVLGLLNADDREGVTVVHKNHTAVPDILWCEVPAGAFLMGSDKQTDPRAYDDEMPQRSVHLETYYMSRYAITNAQFKAFMDVGGYSKREYWTDAGWEMKVYENWTAPAYDDNDDFNIPNQPVIRISWYEAYAYTRWLHDVLTANSPDGLTLRDDYVFRLATESEWEKAARGTDGRIYPYGNTFDKTKGNTFESGIGKPSAVGLFPSGGSPYGVLDMSGNVYDWCLTKWRDAYADPEDNHAQGAFRRAVRSGGFANGSFNARCAYRYNGLPRVRRNYYGIRCVYGPKV